MKNTTASKHARLKMTLTWSHSIFATLLPMLDEKLIVLDEIGICSSVALANGRATNGAAPKRRRNRTIKSCVLSAVVKRCNKGQFAGRQTELAGSPVVASARIRIGRSSIR
jgi:hypothetical protein